MAGWSAVAKLYSASVTVVIAYTDSVCLVFSFEVMLPYGNLLVGLQRVANPYEKIWAMTEDVIAERTNASGQNNEHVISVQTSDTNT